MPKAGRYDYPAVSLDDALQRIRKLREGIKGTNVMTREVASQAMGMSEKGGRTGTVIASLAMYGLIDTGEREVRITNLADTILYGSQGESEQAKRQAVMSIEIFKNLSANYGVSPTDEQIRLFLRQNAVAELPQIPSLAAEIGKIYMKNAVYLSVAEKREFTVSDFGKGTESVSVSRVDTTPMSQKMEGDDLIELRSGKAYARFSKSDLTSAREIADQFSDWVNKLLNPTPANTATKPSTSESDKEN